MHNVIISNIFFSETVTGGINLPSCAGGRPKRKGRSDVEQMIELQQQTLAGVQQLVSIQQQLLEVKKMKLELQQEMVAMKKVEMIKNGMIPGEDGVWSIVTPNTEE